MLRRLPAAETESRAAAGLRGTAARSGSALAMTARERYLQLSSISLAVYLHHDPRKLHLPGRVPTGARRGAQRRILVCHLGRAPVRGAQETRQMAGRSGGYWRCRRCLW
jgi:hypothetical protein